MRFSIPEPSTTCQLVNPTSHSVVSETFDTNVIGNALDELLFVDEFIINLFSIRTTLPRIDPNSFGLNAVDSSTSILTFGIISPDQFAAASVVVVLWNRNWPLRKTAILASSKCPTMATSSYLDLGSIKLPTGATSKPPAVNSSGVSILRRPLQRADKVPPIKLRSPFR